MTNEIDPNADTIDSRDVIARIEELQVERADIADEIASRTEAMPEYVAGCGEWPELDELCEALAAWDDENGEELAELIKLQEQAESSPDWQHGEALIASSYFVTYIEQLIDDCYEMPEAMKSGEWPYRHMTLDIEAAAREAEQDYFEVTFFGHEFLIRA